MAMRKMHIPAPGKGSGLRGEALCGIYANYGTGDHDLVRRLAIGDINADKTGHWCKMCIKKITKQNQAD